MRNETFFGYKREIFSKWLVDCTKLFSVILIDNVEAAIPDRRNCSAKMLPVSSQSRRSLLDFLPEDQSDTTMSRTAWFTTVILFCYLKSVISGSEDKPPDANSCMQKVAKVSYQQ